MNWQLVAKRSLNSGFGMIKNYTSVLSLEITRKDLKGWLVLDYKEARSDTYSMPL